MKYTTVASALLFTEAALGARFTKKRWENHAKRALSRTSLPPIPADDSTLQGLDAGNETAHVEYSTNWAGAVLIGTGYTSVTGTIVVPTPETPSGGSSRTEYAARSVTHALSSWPPYKRIRDITDTCYCIAHG